MFAYFEWLLVVFPLSGACINAVFGHRLGRRAQTWMATGALVGSLFMLIPLAMSQVLRPGLVGHPQAISWFRVWDGDKFLEGSLALRVDTLSVFAASAIVLSGFLLVTNLARRPPAGTPHHLLLAALDAALAALLLAVLADNLTCLLLGWAVSEWCIDGVAWALQGAVPLPAQAGCSSQEASPRLAGLVPRMLSLASDLSLLFALGFLAHLLPGWNVDLAPMLAQLAPDQAMASRELDAAAVFWLLASLLRIGRWPARTRFLVSGSGVTDAAAYALSSGLPGAYLIVRGSSLLTMALSQHLPGPSSWSQAFGLQWWWFGIGAAIAMLGYALVRRIYRPTAHLSARPARIAGLWGSVYYTCSRMFPPLIRTRVALWWSTTVAWVRQIEEVLQKLLRGAEPTDDEPPHLVLRFLLLGTLLVLAYFLLR